MDVPTRAEVDAMIAKAIAEHERRFSVFGVITAVLSFVLAIALLILFKS